MKAMFKAINGSPSTELTESITASSQTITVDNINAFPLAPNLAVIGSDETAEIIMYRGKSGSSLTNVSRGMNDTTANSWSQGTVIARNYTTFDHDGFVDNINELNTNKLNISEVGNLAYVDTVGLNTDVEGVLDVLNGGTGKDDGTNLLPDGGEDGLILSHSESGPLWDTPQSLYPKIFKVALMQKTDTAIPAGSTAVGFMTYTDSQYNVIAVAGFECSSNFTIERLYVSNSTTVTYRARNIGQSDASNTIKAYVLCVKKI